MTLIEHYLKLYFGETISKNKLKEIENYLINNGYEVNLDLAIKDNIKGSKKKLCFKGDNRIAYVKTAPCIDEDFNGESLVLYENLAILDEKNPYFGYQAMKTFDIRTNKDCITLYKAIYTKNDYKNYFQSNVYFNNGLLSGEINLPNYEDLNIDNPYIGDALKKHNLLLTVMGEIADKALDSLSLRNKENIKEKTVKQP